MVEEEPTLLTAAEKQQISEEVLHEVFGLGPLEPLLQDPGISDILVNGPEQVYVERKGVLERTSVRFHDDGHLLRIIDKIVSQVGRRVDESNPDGGRASERWLARQRHHPVPWRWTAPLLSIRRFGTDKLMPDDLVTKGALTRGMMRLLEAAVQRQAEHHRLRAAPARARPRCSTRSPCFISPKERIVTIEDAAELQLKQPHVVRLETRPANLEGHGAVRQRQLLINSLRMRPDRIIVGEVRGEEALDMLQAMNTGHDGSLTTVHANTPRDAISRLEVMVTLANANMHLAAIRQQIASAVHILVQCSRLSDGTRRVTNITEVTGMEGDIVTLQDIFVFEKRGLSPDGRVRGTVLRHRHPAQIQRKAGGRGNPPACRDVRRNGRRRRPVMTAALPGIGWSRRC